MILGRMRRFIRGFQSGVAFVPLLIFVPMSLIGQSPSASTHKHTLSSGEDAILIDGTPVPTFFADAINSVKVPEAENGWVVQVITRGGFNGAGRGDIAITSNGSVECNAPHTKCRNELTREALQGLTQFITRAKPSSWGGCNRDTR